MDNPELTRRMRALVGRRCVLSDGEWQVLDVLPDEDSIVIRRVGAGAGPPPVQAAAWGNATRRPPETRIVPFTEDNGDISAEAEALLRALQSR